MATMELKNPERATPMMGLYHDVFVDRFIFLDTFLSTFFPRKMESLESLLHLRAHLLIETKLLIQ